MHCLEENDEMKICTLEKDKNKKIMYVKKVSGIDFCYDTILRHHYDKWLSIVIIRARLLGEKCASSVF